MAIHTVAGCEILSLGEKDNFEILVLKATPKTKFELVWNLFSEKSLASPMLIHHFLTGKLKHIITSQSGDNLLYLQMRS